MLPVSPGAHGSIENQLLSLFLYLGSEWVLYVLLFLSVVSVAITIERLVHFFVYRDDVDALARDVASLLDSGNIDGVRARLDTSRSHVAIILRRGVDGLSRGKQAMEQLMASAAQLERLRMERGLAFLGTLGSNAPFLGLFGTVLGIIRAFRDLSTNTTDGAQAVMAGIAEALIATAVGLLVALPAVAVFNAFQRAIKARLTESDSASRVLLAHVTDARAREV